MGIVSSPSIVRDLTIPDEHKIDQDLFYKTLLNPKEDDD